MLKLLDRIPRWLIVTVIIMIIIMLSIVLMISYKDGRTFVFNGAKYGFDSDHLEKINLKIKEINIKLSQLKIDQEELKKSMANISKNDANKGSQIISITKRIENLENRDNEPSDIESFLSYNSWEYDALSEQVRELSFNVNQSLAISFFVQAHLQMLNSNYMTALDSYLRSLSFIAVNGNKVDIGTVNAGVKTCLEKIDRKEIMRSQGLRSLIIQVINTMKKTNDSDYHKSIAILETALDY